jgi:hypothetical protein
LASASTIILSSPGRIAGVLERSGCSSPQAGQVGIALGSGFGPRATNWAK